MKHTCPVCGYPALREAPRSKGSGGSFEICPSCGFQFGVTDDDQGLSYEQWRDTWRDGGMKWSSQQAKPANWNPAAQVARISGAQKKKR
jgi:transcription elongation factor Elf1